MAEQIRKIIFTTKEAYDQKVAAGTLDNTAIYAIDASQVATTTEVKATVDNSFDKFGLELGINKDGAEFYHTPLDLAGMVKEIVKTKYDVAYTGIEHINVGNGTKTLSVSHISNPNTYITAIQDGTEHGFVPFTVDNKIAHVTVPDAVDVTREFELKASNVFNTLHDTIKVITSSENIVVGKLNEFASTINTETGVIDMDSNISPLHLYDNALYITEESQKDISNFINYQYRVIIADKSITFNSDDIDAMKRAAENNGDNFYILIVDKTFTSYVDLGTGVWKDFPASVSATTTKLGDYYNYALNINTTRENKVNTAMAALNLTGFNAETTYKLEEGTDFTDEPTKAKLVNAEALVFGFMDNALEITTKLAELSKTNTMKVKVVAFSSNYINSEIFKKLNEIPTLQVVFSGRPSPDFSTIDERVSFIDSEDTDRKMWVSIKPGDGVKMPIPSADNDTLNTIMNAVFEAVQPKPVG